MNNDFATAAFHVSNAEQWQADWDIAKKMLPAATVQEIDNGICLPLKYSGKPGKFNHVFCGGCCDANGNFVAGHSRRENNTPTNLSCISAYPVPEAELEFRDETVIFGGMLIGHWGHLITDSSARLWYPVRHPELKCKIVFLECLLKNFAAKEDWKPLFQKAGIDPERVEMLQRPTRFRKIIVPDQAVYSLDAIRPEWIEFFDAVRASAAPSPFSKVYFSRAKFSKSDTQNEDLFESYYEEAGFHIVHPEDCSLHEEISLLAGADELVATIGTLSHNFLFAKPGARATVLLRTGSILRLQLLIGAARRLQSRYVEAFRNVLPTTHYNGAFYLFPTWRFLCFLASSGLAPFGGARLSAACEDGRVRAYVEKWFDVYSARVDAFDHSSSRDFRARSGLASLFVGMQDADTREKLIEAVVSFVRTDLERTREFLKTQHQLKKTKEQMNQMWRRSFRGRVYSLLCLLRLVRPDAKPAKSSCQREPM